jgi:hypothetical protein
VGPKTKDGADESGIGQASLGVGTGCVGGGAAILQGRPHRAVVAGGGKEARQDGCRNGAGQKARRGVVRDVAGPQAVRPSARDARHGGAGLVELSRARVCAPPCEGRPARPATLPSHSEAPTKDFDPNGLTGEGCPEAVIAGRARRLGWPSWSMTSYTSIATRRRTSTLAALTANSRLRQLAPRSAQLELNADPGHLLQWGTGAEWTKLCLDGPATS